jgi:hypothetical protein
MRRLLSMITLSAALAAAVLAFSPASFAASPAQECTSNGGSWTAAGPDSSCTYPGTPVGNSDNTKGGSSTSGPGKSAPNSDTSTCTGTNNKPHSCP